MTKIAFYLNPCIIQRLLRCATQRVFCRTIQRLLCCITERICSSIHAERSKGSLSILRVHFINPPNWRCKIQLNIVFGWLIYRCSRVVGTQHKPTCVFIFSQKSNQCFARFFLHNTDFIKQHAHAIAGVFDA